jgi:F-type H+-transporting ATPase subunit delta
MKKITAKQYAVGLYQSIKDTSSEDTKKKIRNFLQLVQKRKNLKMLDKIYKAFIEVYQEQEGQLSAEIVSSHHLSEKVRSEISQWLKSQTGRTAALSETVDEQILGGVIIKYGDTIIDASLKNSLKKMQQALSK